ncbi:MAG: TlpA family protein disulfide reductase [Planctomycetaceae bacterium]|nr:TlpA family protein disulfide reductase [Planctomycetaceae bacterium]
MGRIDPRVSTQQQQALDERKKERLLTLPRMQKTNPPTHLICAQNGDYLRGRIIEMNDEMLRIELRLETREIPRDRISKIIWLHPEEVTGQKPDEPEGDEASPAVAEAEGIRVHVVRSNGIRLTFNALNVDSEKISGINATLGPCEAPFNEVGKVLIGSAIEEAAAETAFQQFKLQLAAEPLAPPENEGGGSERTGRESPLVGKDAPDIRLKLLAGGDFNLDEKQGKIVLIDFWASWCGPCRRTLPLVHSVAEEFKERGVELITVNLEESSDQITDALERLQLDMPVAMDVTGKVGGKYAVTSIPSTVIVDKQGKIARVYVGGSDDFDEELRRALGELLGDVKPSEDDPEKKNESETSTDPVKDSPPTN